MSALLEVRKLCKHYGELRAVDSLSFQLAPREILGVSGPNGAGKTTTFDVITGMTPSTSGQVIFDGEDITGCTPSDICHRGLVRSFQLNAGFDGLTLEQNVLIGAAFGHPGIGIREVLFGSNRARERAREAIDFVGMDHKRNLLISEANVFERKLTMIASAVATDPKVFMLDEPVGGLVPAEIEAMQELVVLMRDRGIAVALIEHVMRFLTALSDRVLVIHQGAHLFEGPSEEMMRDPAVRAVYLGSASGSESADE